MTQLIKYFFIVAISFICLTCKKKTSISVKLFNPALGEYVANATIALVEKKGESGGGIFSGNASCNEIATAVTDANGACFFDSEKLHTNSKYNYFCAVKESWGLKQSYPCGGKTSNFIGKGKPNDIVVIDEANGDLQIQYNNLLNPSQQDDSLIVSLVTIEYSNPDGSIIHGNGGVFGAFPFYGCNGFPFPATIVLPIINIKAQKLKRSIRKRKMGIVTSSIDTVKVYPNRTNTIQINW